jgi:hypothetical protein
MARSQFDTPIVAYLMIILPISSLMVKYGHGIDKDNCHPYQP